MVTDLRQAEGWSRYLSSQGWRITEVKGKKLKCKIYTRRIPLIGSVIKIQRPTEVPPVKEIDRIAKNHRALFVKFEPLLATNYQLLTKHGFKSDPNPNLPTKTTIVDLTKGEKELWKDLSQDARQSIKKAIRYKMQVTNYRWGEDGFEQALMNFHQLLRKTGERQHFLTPKAKQLKAKTKAFGKNAVVFLAYTPKQSDNQTVRQPIAGTLFLISDTTVYYHYAASSLKGRELHAPYLLLWKAIKFFKSSTNHQLPSINSLDLEGIYDPRYPKATKRWKGFTTFKKKFGGTELEHSRPLIKYYNLIIRLLFELAG